jgi:hypothetical protein
VEVKKTLVTRQLSKHSAVATQSKRRSLWKPERRPTFAIANIELSRIQTAERRPDYAELEK